MALRRMSRSLLYLLTVAVTFIALVTADYYHADGNVNCSGSYYETTYGEMGLGVDTIVNATDLILFEWAYGTNNVTNTWGVSDGLFNPDCDFNDDGFVDGYDGTILSKNYSGPPITALVDIQPTTLNFKSNGQNISVYITFADYSFLNNLDIYLWSVRIDGIYASGFIGWHKVAFIRSEIRDYIAGEIDYEQGVKFYDLILTVVGSVAGAPFQGSNLITVIKG